jgi:hypothetical protein
MSVVLYLPPHGGFGLRCAVSSVITNTCRGGSSHGRFSVVFQTLYLRVHVGRDLGGVGARRGIFMRPQD